MIQNRIFIVKEDGVEMEKYVHIRIMELLKEKKISRTKICKDLDLQRDNFNKYCKDAFLRIDAALIIELCNYFQCEIAGLLEIRELNDSNKETTQSPVTFRPIRRTFNE